MFRATPTNLLFSPLMVKFFELIETLVLTGSSIPSWNESNQIIKSICQHSMIKPWFYHIPNKALIEISYDFVSEMLTLVATPEMNPGQEVFVAYAGRQEKVFRFVTPSPCFPVTSNPDYVQKFNFCPAAPATTKTLHWLLHSSASTLTQQPFAEDQYHRHLSFPLSKLNADPNALVKALQCTTNWQKRASPDQPHLHTYTSSLWEKVNTSFAEAANSYARSTDERDAQVEQCISNLQTELVSFLDKLRHQVFANAQYIFLVHYIAKLVELLLQNYITKLSPLKKNLLLISIKCIAMVFALYWMGFSVPQSIWSMLQPLLLIIPKKLFRSIHTGLGRFFNRTNLMLITGFFLFIISTYLGSIIILFGLIMFLPADVAIKTANYSAKLTMSFINFASGTRSA